jgi:Phosphate-selective porin O and P
MAANNNRRMIGSLSLAVLLALGAGSAHSAEPGPGVEERLAERIERMQSELESMKAELQAVKAQNAALAARQAEASADRPDTAPAPAGGLSPDLSLWGYGEIYYLHPVHDTSLTRFDLARAVFGIGYRFDDATIFNSEFEIEHAVTSSSDRGEFEVEQFYIDHRLSDSVAVKAGLFLMPFGLLNEHHEPTSFYGVQRNFVETLVIPSTWREGGVGLHGSTTAGLVWDAGITTGLDLGGWQVNPDSPLYRTAYELDTNGVAPMQATHQELQFAKAQHLSQYVSLNYSGLPGLFAGAAAFTGKAARPEDPAGLPDPRVTLWEAHARWTPGRADLSAVYARGQISGTAAFNLANPGAANPLPSQFLGYYLQGAYSLWQNGSYRLVPFARWEHYDMGAAYQGIAPGFGTVPGGLAADGKPWPQPRDRVWTAGVSFYLNPSVVVKADYQQFEVNPDLTRFDVGLGLRF